MEKKVDYPKYLFPKDGPAVLVQSEDEHKALVGEFKESPADWKADEKSEELKKEDPSKSEKTYREHMAEWESKKEKQEHDQADVESQKDIAAIKADLIAEGFKETQLKKKTEEEIRALHATLKG